MARGDPAAGAGGAATLGSGRGGAPAPARHAGGGRTRHGDGEAGGVAPTSRGSSRGADRSAGAGQSHQGRQSQLRQQSRQSQLRQQSQRRTAGSASGVRRPPSSASADPGAAAAAVASRGSAAPMPPPSAAASAGSGRRAAVKPSLEFSRRARAVEYTPKTLEQYKAAQPADGRYVELGTLGPDLSTEELSRKHAQRRKVRDYSKRVARSVKAPAAPRAAPQAEERHRVAERRAVPSARERAMVFARSRVPQPKTRSPAGGARAGRDGGGGGGSGDSGGGVGGGGRGHRGGGGGSGSSRVRGGALRGGTAGPSPLEALEAEHDRLAARVAGIRQLV